MQNSDIINLFQKSGGYLNSTQLIKNKVHTSTIRKLLKTGKIEKIKRGLYRLAPDELPQHNYFTYDYFDATIGVPAGIFCLTTALFYHNLTTTRPITFDMAIPPSHRNTKLNTVSLRLYRFNEPYYSLDIKKIKTNITVIKIYEKEKSICDAIRLRHIIGEDVAMESLNSYMRLKEKEINKLLQTAKICKVTHIVEPAIKAMTGF
ncbi:hypothetical protein GF407_01680 [candidate division KSB1 bacterium]|nr:hypothetical protein [candidate division KSB1 bacterium]